MVRCILACDLLGGVVVRGVRGERDRYRPVSEYSRVVDTSSPVEMIMAMKPKETYVADLDRITGRGSNLDTIDSLSQMTRIMADTGIAKKSDATATGEVSQSIILGTETASLSLIEECQGTNTIVSVDMKHGRMMACDSAFMLSPLEVVRKLNILDLEAIILLDVGRVGSGEGVDLDFLKNAVSASRHDVIVGGGVRGPEDLDETGRCGCKAAIVASAVHSGALPLSVLW